MFGFKKIREGNCFCWKSSVCKNKKQSDNYQTNYSHNTFSFWSQEVLWKSHSVHDFITPFYAPARFFAFSVYHKQGKSPNFKTASLFFLLHPLRIGLFGDKEIKRKRNWYYLNFRDSRPVERRDREIIKYPVEVYLQVMSLIVQHCDPQYSNSPWLLSQK